MQSYSRPGNLSDAYAYSHTYAYQPSDHDDNTRTYAHAYADAYQSSDHDAYSDAYSDAYGDLSYYHNDAPPAYAYAYAYSDEIGRAHV